MIGKDWHPGATAMLVEVIRFVPSPELIRNSLSILWKLGI